MYKKWWRLFIAIEYPGASYRGDATGSLPFISPHLLSTTKVQFIAQKFVICQRWQKWTEKQAMKKIGLQIDWCAF